MFFSAIRQPKASTSSTPEVTSNISGGTGAASAIVPWMNDATLSVCAASPLPTAAHSLKRPLDAIRDPLTSGDKRVKLDSPYDDFKNGLIGIAVKSDNSAIVGASPPSAPRVSAASGGVHLNDASTVTSTAGGNSSAPWSTQLLSRPRSDTSEQRPSTTSSSVVETTHPVDPGHNAPSTSLAPSVPSTSVSANANSVALPLQGTTSLFVNTSMGPPSIASTVAVGGGVPTGSGILSARDFTPSATDPRATPQSALLDPLRQAFLSNPSFAASLNAAAGFGNAFLAGAPPNAAAAAFPFLAAQILQQQQGQQPISLPQSGSVGGASSVAGMTQPSAPNTAAAVAAGVQFPPGAALGSQLAGAALLGRTLPATAGLSQTALPIKAKQGRWCAMHVKIAYEISSRKERRATPQPINATSVSSSQSAATANTLRNTAPVAPPLCPPSTSNAHLASLTGGFSNTFSAMAAAGALQPPFGSLPFQQLTDPNKLVRQTTTPKPPQGRPASAMQRGGTTAAAPGGMHLQLGAAGMGAAASLGAASMSLGAANALQSAIPNVVGASLPLTAALPASGSLTNGTSDAAAQAAMFAALAQGAQQGTGLPSAALSSNPFLLSAAAAQQQHPLSAAAMAAGTPSQSQTVFPSQRLFDPTMTAAVLQQMQSMEAMRQSAAAAQMNAAAAVAAANASQHASATGAANATTLDLMRLQMEQQMMERYAAAMNAATASSTGTPAAPNAGQPSSSHSLDIMRQQLFAAQLRQQQQQQQQAAAVAAATQQQSSAAAQQPSLEALIEMQRQQQQQQQLLNASRAALPGGYAVPVVATAGIPSSPSLPQGLSASGFFNASHLMSMSGAAAAAANLQQSLYGKNPYSNTLEQLARQKRDGDMMQQGR
uniref:Uncharacterized protein n=1 Tax=Ascaris lumbricoides TaxID=6252 RepID=A0A9J2P516_ASCLU